MDLQILGGYQIVERKDRNTAIPLKQTVQERGHFGRPALEAVRQNCSHRLDRNKLREFFNGQTVVFFCEL